MRLSWRSLFAERIQKRVEASFADGRNKCQWRDREWVGYPHKNPGGREKRAMEWQTRGRRLEGGRVKITRCAGNDRKYKPGEISQAREYTGSASEYKYERDCSIPSFTPRPSFFLSVAPAAASFLLRPERRGVKCSMPPNIRIAHFPGISLYFVGIKA